MKKLESSKRIGIGIQKLKGKNYKRNRNTLGYYLMKKQKKMMTIVSIHLEKNWWKKRDSKDTRTESSNIDKIGLSKITKENSTNKLAEIIKTNKQQNKEEIRHFWRRVWKQKEHKKKVEYINNMRKEMRKTWRNFRGEHICRFTKSNTKE